MQNDWWTGLAERTQRYADMGDMPAFYEPQKAVYGPSHYIQAPLRSSDGSTLLTNKEAILQRWSEYFEGLFSDRRTVQESSLAKIPRVNVKLEVDDPPTREEIRKATMQLKVTKLQVYRAVVLPPPCTVQRPGFSIGSRSGYCSGFTNAACAPSLASNGKTTCRTNKSSREPAFPAWSPSCFRCSCAGLVMSQTWKTYACSKQSSSASSKKKSCLLYTSPSPRDSTQSRMPSSA